ncbi:hypothetical protein BJX68DRAFT_218412 [Aspergillus pseudodeflectus]|uniref:Jacalin-type lectin domain-containing protein n=1 Tax=Aspergillus pseudodeflectus TaxID=176178 RepID=A0ABR4JFR4_9EURO
MVVLNTFNGPLEPLPIARWLDTSEDIFKDEASAPLEDKDKIHAAGKAISASGDTESLHNWFTENRPELEEMSWIEFKDALKDQALGTGWRIHALRDFFTTRSDGQTLQDYLTGLEHKFFILKRNDPAFTELYENLYKWYLLFNAPPNLVDQVVKNEVYYDDKNLLLARPLEVKKWLRKYDDPAVVAPSSISSQIASSGTYLHSGLTGYPNYYHGAWTDLYHLPKKSTDLGRLTSISILWIQNYRSTGLAYFSGYRTQFSGPSNLSVGDVYDSTNNATTQTLTLDPGEYIKSIKVSVKPYDISVPPHKATNPTIDGIEIITSNPDKKISFGNLSSPDDTIVAPLGWGIVGFYGTYYDNDAVRPKLGHALRLRSRIGAIMLPL